MSGRTITYDEIHMEILARHDLTAEQRHELLCFIRDFRDTVAPQLLAKAMPEHMRAWATVRVS